MTITKQQYRAARKTARQNKGRGLWLHNPIRLTPGYPGLWVGSDSRIYGWFGFTRMWETL